MNRFENGMTKLLVSQLAELYFCENQLLHALDRMEAAAKDPSLKKLFGSHRVETSGQILRLESMFRTLQEQPRVYPCRGMEGLLEDGLWTIRELKDEPVLDTALIAGAHKVEMLEIAAYRSVILLARHLGHESIAALCEVSLAEESMADEKLARIGANAQMWGAPANGNAD